jgi:serine/threonine-protein kinase
VSIRRTLGQVYLYARRYDQARYHLVRATAMNPMAEETYRVLGLANALDGEYEEAERVLREALAMPEPSNYTWATLAYALGRAGRRDEALDILAQLEETARGGYVSPVAFATIFLGLGDVERALDYAERAYDERRGWVAYLRVNAIVDPLRGQPRFEALSRRIGLPEA